LFCNLKFVLLYISLIIKRTCLYSLELLARSGVRSLGHLVKGLQIGSDRIRSSVKNLNSIPSLFCWSRSLRSCRHGGCAYNWTTRYDIWFRRRLSLSTF